MSQKGKGSRVVRLTCEDPTYGSFSAELVAIGDRPDQLAIWRSLDQGRTWSEIPQSLGLRSRLFNGLRRHWPPQKIVSLSIFNDSLCLVFRDPWLPTQEQVVKWLDQESEWRATYSFRKEKWDIERIKFLNYENDDVPPL